LQIIFFTEDDHIIPLEWIGANLIEEQFVTEVIETYQYFVVQHLYRENELLHAN
jgi:hypothetical protein